MPSEDALLARMYADGAQLQQIADALKRTKTAIKVRCQQGRLRRNSAHTNVGQFGARQNLTWKPLGSVRQSPGAVARIKAHDTGAQSDWVPLHNLIWKELHGSIPDGHFIRYLDGDVRNLDPSNLILVTRAENVIANRWQAQGALPEGGITTLILLAKIREKLRTQNQGVAA